ncbi:hypothetical protein NDU88_010110 [Pleurodeles waltl]|uniref:Uncharacterized protein n=1 Tax=Pleurodeles waltl TaxID=8319 RepID=A0AAV7QWJ3_PLEWA|nr:hypothetical protein NDU88_010110 [Pleurodeles waltl]
MAWAFFCWRDGGGLVISSLSLPADVAACSGGRIFGGLAVVGQNDCGGFPRPRRCYGGLLTSGKRLLPPSASVCGAARRNYDLTAGVASISPLDFDLRGCALKLRSHGRRCVDFSSRGRAALSLRGRASDLRSSQERCVIQCGDFLAAKQAVCRNFRRTERPSKREKSFWS